METPNKRGLFIIVALCSEDVKYTCRAEWNGIYWRDYNGKIVHKNRILSYRKVSYRKPLKL